MYTHTPHEKEITIGSLVSLVMSILFLLMATLYMGIKTLICPKFSELDRALAGILYEYVDGDFLAIIANSKSPDMPEARTYLMFELGLLFEE